MRKYIPTVIALCLMFGLIAVGAQLTKANAAEGPALHNCVAYTENTTVVEPVTDPTNKHVKFDMSMCTARGMRLWKDEARGQVEYKELRNFSEILGSPNEPIVFCGNKRASYSIDLTYNNIWVGSKNKAERKHYKTWTKRYAKRHHCVLFNEN